MNKIWYRAAPGVAWVNGASVPDDGRVLLSEAEAAFDLGLERIAPEVQLPVLPSPEPEPEPEIAKHVSPLPSQRRRRGQVK